MAQKITPYILSSLQSLTLFIPIYAKSANASKASAEWGALNTANPRFNNELLWENTICDEIATMFTNSGSWSNNNNYHSSTTTNNVYNYLSYVDDPFFGIDWSTNWWVGDFSHPSNKTPAPFGYFGCFTSTPNSYVWDYDIYNHATNNGAHTSKNYFTFMWTCANGGLYWNPTSGSYPINVEGEI